MAGKSKIVEAEAYYARVYAEIERVIQGLRGEKLRKAKEIEARIYKGELSPGEALQRIKALARS